jgi:type IV pilus assembly protein PilP
VIAPTASCAAAWVLRRALLLALFGGLLVACEAENQDLQAWMALQHREAKPRVQPLAAPKKFEPVPYANAGQVDPFSSQKLIVAIKQQAGQPNSLLASEANRRKQPLELLPLDAMSMVGSVNKDGVAFALIKVDKQLYQVRLGDYLGPNFGRVTRVSETELGLRELVQDAAGEWTERAVSLQLQERAQEKAR